MFFVRRVVKTRQNVQNGPKFSCQKHLLSESCMVIDKLGWEKIDMIRALVNLVNFSSSYNKFYHNVYETSKSWPCSRDFNVRWEGKICREMNKIMRIISLQIPCSSLT